MRLRWALASLRSSEVVSERGRFREACESVILEDEASVDGSTVEDLLFMTWKNEEEENEVF